MDLSVHREEPDPTPAKRYVRVESREDTGVVVEQSKTFGNVSCFGIYFPKTGEVLHFEKSRVIDVKDGITSL